MERTAMMGVGVLALALAWGSPARAEDAQKARAEAQQEVDKAKADAAKDRQKARADASEKVRKADADANREVDKAEHKAAKKEESARQDESRHAARADAARDTHAALTPGHGDRRHTVFEGKDNWDVKGKISKVSGDSVTLHRDDLPDVTLKTSTGTRVQVDGNDARVSQLRPGQDVRASFNLKGSDPMAVEIKADSHR